MARKRDYRGRFIRVLMDSPADERCWFIWSKKWNCWHRRSESGGACGYTDDIAQAGIFVRAKAVEYHDGYDNEAFHVSERLAQIDRRIAAHRTEADLIANLASAASSDSPASDGSTHVAVEARDGEGSAR